MAADYSYTVVRLFDRLLGWLWEKLYHGVNVRGMEHVRDVAEDCQLIYVPCHRSHIDYLLLSYVVFKNGLMPPHIAAGINLNLPVLGGFLRRAGAFFIRRQFRDNKLYRAVLESYIGIMCEKGVPIEYFIEGGRSRTGFLLPAKVGMLAMTMRAAQDQQLRPLAFIPVYFGYERLLESHSYINELYGEKKQRESLFDLFSARRYLKENYGRVFVSFGSAVRADDIWQSLAVNDFPRPADGELFVAAVDRLGQSIQTQVNNIASLSSLNLVATALLGSKRSALLEGQLSQQLDLLRALVKVPVYRANIVLESFSNKQAIEYAFSLGLLRRNQHALGDILYLDQKAQIGATFLRNNSLHVFILPSLVASILINTRRASLRLIQAVCYRFYPYLQAEYFLPWDRDGLVAVIEHVVAVFSDAGLVYQMNDYYCCQVSDSEQYHALMVLAGGSRGSLERFYITARLVTSRTEGHYDRAELEQACVQMAERLSLLHEFHAPDFFDKNLFRIFISSLIREKIFNEDSSGKLSYGSAFLKAKKLDKYVLSPAVRRSIRHITSADQ
jgi:glycerol-3-phosphate O-acyltransferase